MSSVNVCIAYLIYPFGFTNGNDPTILGISLVVFGVIGMAVICKLVFKRKVY